MRTLPLVLAAVLAATPLPVLAQQQTFQSGADLLAQCRSTDAATIAKCDVFLADTFNLAETLLPLCAQPTANDLRAAFLRYALAHPESLREGRATPVMTAFGEAFPCGGG